MTDDHARALEQPHQAPAGEPLWAENYAWPFFDPQTGAGALMHLGRMPIGDDLWRSTVVAYLPDGKLVVSKTVIPGHGDPLATGGLTFTCHEPLRRWSLRFRGAGRLTSTSALSASRIDDHDLVALDIDIEFEALTPIWDVGAMMSMGDTHYEQHGRYTGTITVDGTTHAVNTNGYRDHSTGKRDLAGLGGHVWTHALFPSGRAFTAFRAYAPDGRVGLNDGVVITGDQLIAAEPDSLPGLTDSAGGPLRGEITLAGHSPISVEVLHGAQLSIGEPNDFHLGYQADRGRKVMLDCPARFEWDGEVTNGWLERSTVLPA